MRRTILSTAFVLAFLAPRPAAAVTFGFDGALGQANDFSVASGGLTATFTSPSGPGTFAVAQPIGLFSFPVALGNYGSFGGDALSIGFSDAITDRISIPFGIVEAFATAPATLVARANTGQTVIFTTAFNDLVSGAPEDVVTFLPTSAITSLTLSSDLAFAIASVDLPEPGSAAVLGAAVIGALALRRPVRGASRRGSRTIPSGRPRFG